MSDNGFVHLHVHSHFSLLDGLIKEGDLVSRVKELGMPAVALTDHGNMFGAVAFYKAAKSAGVKPIIGIEAYVAPKACTEKKQYNECPTSFHLTLLAKNETGYRNLCKLSSAAYIDGFYYKPRIDKELLKAHSEGLIVLSGCLSSELSFYIQQGQAQKAEELLDFYRGIFAPDDFYLEIHLRVNPRV